MTCASWSPGGHRIGTHGYGHVDWRRLDADGAVREFDEARACLADAVGRPVDEAAVPFGRYDRRVLRALRARGFAAVYTSDRGLVRGAPWIPTSQLRAGRHGPGAVRAILAGRQGPPRASAARSGSRASGSSSRFHQFVTVRCLIGGQRAA